MSKRQGKGIEALISSHSTEENDRYIDGSIALKNIIANKNQPRKEFDSNAMEELINSIRENGILQPITVRPIKKGKYEIVAGERRFRAAAALKLESIPAYILSVDTDVEMMEYALIENIQRVDLNPIEEAEGYAILCGKYNLAQEEIAKRVGKSRPTITNSLRLLKLPPEIKSALKSGDISAGHARAILGVRKSLQMMTLYQKVIRSGLNVRQTEELVKNIAESSKELQKIQKSAPRNSEIVQIENNLISKFGTKVVIQKKRGGKGKIQIEFYSDSDLQRILDTLTDI